MGSQQCGLYRSGHNVHHIQARIVTERAHERVRMERLSIIDGELAITIEAATTSYWNHHIERLADALQRRTGSALLLESLLLVPSHDGWRTFSLASRSSACSGRDVSDVAAICLFDEAGAAVVTESRETLRRRAPYGPLTVADGALT
jgi:hypothetical protein